MEDVARQCLVERTERLEFTVEHGYLDEPRILAVARATLARSVDHLA